MTLHLLLVDITPAMTVEVKLAFSVDLLSDETVGEKAKKMFYISSESSGDGR